MIMGEQAEEVLYYALTNAKDLEHFARRFRERKLTREQFTAVVEEISVNLRRQIEALMVEEEDLLPEDIPF